MWTTQNKVLPGAYINFISVASADAKLSERGYASMPLELDWGPDDEIFTVTADDFKTRAFNIFGHDFMNDKLKGLRDLFLYAQTLYAYRLNSGDKATCTYADAKYSGIRGNDLKVIITKNVDDGTKFDVMDYLGATKINSQTVATAAELKDDDFIIWKKDATLAVTAGTSLSGGTNGVTNTQAYQTYLDLAENYSFNTMGIVTTDDDIKKLCVNYVKRLRDDVGVKFQLVLHNSASDYEGVINVKNNTTNDGWSEASAVYWLTGAEAGCAVNASLTNKKYDGEFSIACDYTQTQLANAIKAGELTFHRVGTEIRVLEDINSFISFMDDKNELFSDNQTIRVIDQIANDDAVLFNTKYLGKIPNDEGGRISLWNDFVKARQALLKIRAIENFSDSDIVVAQGDTKKSVYVTQQITVVNAMTHLYMTVKVV